jgi:hypothetical protein
MTKPNKAILWVVLLSWTVAGFAPAAAEECAAEYKKMESAWAEFSIQVKKITTPHISSTQKIALCGARKRAHSSVVHWATCSKDNDQMFKMLELTHKITAIYGCDTNL